MSEKLEIFNPPRFDNSIVREEIHTYHTQTKSYEPNDSFEITINQNDRFISWSESDLCISGRLEEIQGAAATAAAPTGDCDLVPNFPMFLFESITYYLNGTEMDKVYNPGVLTTIKALLLYNESESKALEAAGWRFGEQMPGIVDTATKKKFAVKIPLHFIFGIFQDYRHILFGKHTFRLVRSRTDDNCYRSSENKTAKVHIDNVELKAKHIFPNDAIKLRLLSNLNKDRSIMIPFRTWAIEELPILKDAKKDVWLVRTLPAVERLQHIVTAFQTDKIDNPKEYPILFDHLDITSIRAYLNSVAYPLDGMKMDHTENKHTECYKAYCDFRASFLNKNSHEPLMSYNEFNKRALYIIDCSRQNEEIQQSTVDLKLEFESNTNFPKNTRAYCVMIHDKVFEYKPHSGICR